MEVVLLCNLIDRLHPPKGFFRDARFEGYAVVSSWLFLLFSLLVLVLNKERSAANLTYTLAPLAAAPSVLRHTGIKIL